MNYKHLVSIITAAVIFLSAVSFLPQTDVHLIQADAVLSSGGGRHDETKSINYNGHSYYVYSDIADNWEEAKRFCEDRGGYLAVINDSNENTAVFNIMKSFGYENAYFGFSDSESEGNWKWVNNVASSYVNWDEGEPNGGLEENYAMFYSYSQDQTWNDGGDFDGTNTFICEWDYEDALSASVKEFGGHSYYVFSGDCYTWEEAKRFCENRGGYLAVINNQKENDELYKLMLDFGYESAYFGYTDKEDESHWKWVSNDQSTYENFNKAEELGDVEPNGDTSENYAMFYYKYKNGAWNDGDFGFYTVNSGKAFICEWDYTNPTPYNLNDGNYTLHYTTNLGREHRSVDFDRTYDIDNIELNDLQKTIKPIWHIFYQ